MKYQVLSDKKFASFKVNFLEWTIWFHFLQTHEALNMADKGRQDRILSWMSSGRMSIGIGFSS